MADGFKRKTVSNGFITEVKKTKKKNKPYRRMGGKVKVDGETYQLNGFLNPINKD
ncbi:MAG: hypothetical protein ACLFUH_05460 [Bacteroidales bacterium]